MRNVKQDRASSPPSATMLGIYHQLHLGSLQKGGGVMTFCSSDMPTTNNVTYSGGQEGVQGGFYGSGGARYDKMLKQHNDGGVSNSMVLIL